jgi:tetratricopeptide (TPR) repeat protein
LALRGQNRYDAAVEAFAAILKSKPNLIQAQIDAAETLQRKADQDRSATVFGQAVSGLADQSIWGWRRIALATRGKESLMPIQCDAIYNLAYCQFRYGEISQREDARQAALRTLADQHKQYPQLAGPRSVERYNALAKQIQTSLGEPAVGLQ